MTKKHFIRAAEIVAARCVYSSDEARVIAEAFMLLFSESNSRFDRRRFLAACGLA